MRWARKLMVPLAVVTSGTGVVVAAVTLYRGEGAMAGRAAWAARRHVAERYDAVSDVPVDALAGPPSSIAERRLPAGLRSFVESWREIESAALGYAVNPLNFVTVDLAGERRIVHCLVLTPPGALDTATIHLPGSGAVEGALLDLEAVAFTLRHEPPRRVVVVPLPLESQRGVGWPALEDSELRGFAALGIQTAVDVQRAAEACAALGWQVDGISGYSLGGCLAACVAGLCPRTFDGTQVTLWAAGGDLDLLLSNSDHWLAGVLRRPADMPAAEYAAFLAGMDPAVLLPRSGAAAVRLVAGWDDEIIPVQCAEALRAACERAGLPCELQAENGGHWLDGKVWATMAGAFSGDLLRALCADFVDRVEGR